MVGYDGSTEQARNHFDLGQYRQAMSRRAAVGRSRFRDMTSPAWAGPVDLPRAWPLPPRDYFITLKLSLSRTKKQGSESEPGPFSVLTKRVTSAVKLTPNATAIVTVSMPGDSLEKRFETRCEGVREEFSGETRHWVRH